MVLGGKNCPSEETTREKAPRQEYASVFKEEQVGLCDWRGRARGRVAGDGVKEETGQILWGLVGLCEDLISHRECDEKPLKGWEQLSTMIWLMF